MNSYFIHIPKSAGTSVKEALGVKTLKIPERIFDNSEYPITYTHLSYPLLVENGYIPESFDKDSYKFCFVRNPYHRAVSIYSYFRWRFKKKSFLTFCRELVVGIITLQHTKHNFFIQDPQVKWLENVNIDFVGHVEKFEQDLKYVANILGIPNIPVKHLNISEHGMIEDYYYHKESRDLIEDFYREDFKHFGYSYGEF